MMKRLMVGAAAAGAFVHPASAAVWINESGANAPETAYLWSASANWQNGEKPKGSATSDLADFSQHGVAPGALRFVRLDEPATSYRIVTAASETLCILGDGDCEYLGAGGSSISGAATGQSSLRLYAPFVGKGGECNFSNVDFCGKVWQSTSKAFASGNTFRANGGQMRYRYDLYALQAGGERVNEGGTYAHQYCWGGNLEWIAPKGSATDVSANWTLVENSPYARLAEGQSAHDLCAGTLVTAANGALPDGTFLKRIFTDGLIELSNAAVVGGETTLTFAAITQKVCQFIDQLNDGIDKNGVFVYSASKYREADDLRIEVRHLAIGRDKSKPENDRLRFTSSTGIPGTFVIHNADGVDSILEFDNCHFEFGGRNTDPNAGSYDNTHGGFPNIQAARFMSSTSFARLTATNNMTACVRAITNLVGTLVKDGAGTVTTTFPNSRSPNGTLNNTGSVIVEAGVLSLTADENGTEAPAVKSLHIAKDGTLAISEAGLSVESFTFERGAVLQGPGKLTAKNLFNAEGLVLTGGALAEVDASASARPVNKVVGEVVGDPAFWVDASDVGSLTMVGENGTNFITRWNDCRGTDAKYLFATNVASVRPSLMTTYACGTAAASNAVLIAFHDATATEIEKTEALVWSRPVVNIRAVFKVHDPNLSGGVCLLGATSRINEHMTDFRRWQKGSVDMNSQIFQSNAHPAVLNGRHYLNGMRAPYTSGYPIATYRSGNTGITHYRTMLQECHPSADGTAADCFGFTTVGNNWNGMERISECIVYTNELSETERLKVAQYLMEKWIGADVSYERFADTSSRFESLDLAEDVSVAVSDGTVAYDSVTGAGTFVKQGQGTVYFDSAALPDGGVRVEGGTLVVRSTKIGADTLPSGAYLHLDAEAADTFTLSSETKVAAWRDVRGTGYPTTTAIGTHDETRSERKAVATLSGRHVVDFGAAHTYQDEGYADGYRPGLYFDKLAKTRTVVMLYGSAQGGGTFIGSRSGSYEEGGIVRSNPDWYGAQASTAFTGTGRQQTPKYVFTNPNVAGGTVVKMDGVRVNQTTTGFNGGYQVVSLTSPDFFATGAFSSMHYGRYFGGQEIGEALIYERALSSNDVAVIEAYLANKWFGTALPAGWTGSEIGTLSVAAGATVEIEGGSPLKVSTLSGAGTVQGAVDLSENASLVVPVAADGSTPTLTLGSVDIGTGANLSFVGEVRKLTVGEHVLVRSSAIHAGDTVGWSVSGLVGGRACTLKAVEGELVAEVSCRGITFILK